MAIQWHKPPKTKDPIVEALNKLRSTIQRLGDTAWAHAARADAAEERVKELSEALQLTQENMKALTEDHDASIARVKELEEVGTKAADDLQYLIEVIGRPGHDLEYDPAQEALTLAEFRAALANKDRGE